MNDSALTVCFYCADQNRHRDRSRGITGYTYGLLSHLRNVPDLNVIALTSTSSFIIPKNIEERRLPFPTDNLAGRLLGDHLHPFIARGNDIDIWHYAKGFVPFGWQVKARRVGTVADVMLQFYIDHHPEARSRLAYDYWLAMLKHSVEKLELIITVSEFSKRSILEFCDRHRLKCPPIFVTYEGVSFEGATGMHSGGKDDCVVHLASKHPHKATAWLLEQWLAMSQTTRDLPLLRLVGDLDTRAAALFSKMKNASLIPPLPRLELEQLLARARALLLPSEIEGFGIPAVEAYLLGTPVAYAKETALEEVLLNDAVGGFSRDFDSFKTAVTDVLNLDRAAIAARAGALERRYTWENCVRLTLDAYQTIAPRAFLQPVAS